MPDLRKFIRVLLVAESSATRNDIRRGLVQAGRIAVVAETSDGFEAIEQVRQFTPDVVVMDLNLARLNGMAATALLMRELPDARVLMLTPENHPEFIVEFIHAGARGCVSAAAPPSELAAAVEKIAAGEAHFGLAETVRYLRRYLPAPPCAVAEPVKALTPREVEVVACIREGLTNRQISERLKVTVRTVETHRERVMRKLDLPDSHALRSFAAAREMLSEVNIPTVSTET